MRPPHPVREIALQCGLSEATVDRALHGRPNVSRAAVRAVEQAVLELDRQAAQVRLGARTLVLDVVMQAPGRFSDAVRHALEAELAWVRPAAVRARFHLRERGSPEDVAELVDGIGRGGRVSHGLLLKAPDHPLVAAAVDRASARGVPVVTLFTDVPRSRRVAYVGLDNGRAGATAAYLLARFVRRPGEVLVPMSRSTFLGEHERVDAFAAELARACPGLRPRVLSDADGLDAETAALVAQALDAQRAEGRARTVAVYSVGGGNRAIVDELDRRGIELDAFVAHDLDADNLTLLTGGRIDVVLHHDLQSDARRAVRQVLRHHGLVAGAPITVPASLEVVTPHSIPARLTGRT